MSETPVYQGQFGEFTITEKDRREVILYRAGLGMAALSFAIAATLVLNEMNQELVLHSLTLLFFLFSAGLGLSLWMIHIYLAPLHRLLQIFWAIGTGSAIAFALYAKEPLLPWIYDHPLALLGIGFSFAALTGIYFKEAFCFNRLETKILTPLVPLLLLGHLFGILQPIPEKILLMLWASLFLVFIGRKLVQEIPPDIGDKSVFTYLKQQKLAQS
ncbi:MAG: DUF2301 domain-containing membrane protein [Microcystaceae cyanobacterium]